MSAEPSNPSGDPETPGIQQTPEAADAPTRARQKRSLPMMMKKKPKGKRKNYRKFLKKVLLEMILTLLLQVQYTEKQSVKRQLQQ